MIARRSGPPRVGDETHIGAVDGTGGRARPGPRAARTHRGWEGATTNDTQLRILTGWLNRNDRLSGLAFALYRRGLHRLDPRRRLLGFDPARYARFERWRRTTDGTARLGRFSMQLEVGRAHRAADYRYLPDTVGTEPSYEVEVVSYLRRHLREGMGFVDVGANSGYFSLWAASLVGERGRVDAFEPDEENFARLNANIKLNSFPWLQAHPVALGRSRSAAPMYASDVDSGCHSFVPIPGHGSAQWTALDTLDGALPDLRADGFKIDVEGLEEDVLAGAQETLGRNPGAFVVFEYNKLVLDAGGRGFDGAFDLLRSWGWEVHRLLPDGTPGRAVRSHRDVGAIVANLVATRAGRAEHRPGAPQG